MRRFKKLAGKAGVEPTVDAEFDEKAKNFEFYHKALKQLLAKAQGLEKGILTGLKATKEVGDALVISDDVTSSHLLSAHSSTMGGLDSALTNVASSLAANVISPLKEYLEQCSMLERRIKNRKDRVKHLDDARNELNKAENAKTRDPMTIKVAQTKVEHTTPIYEKVNAEVAMDITRIVSAIPEFMQFIIASFCDTQTRYYEACAAAYGQVNTSAVDKSAFLSIPSYVTPLESSATTLT